MNSSLQLPVPEAGIELVLGIIHQQIAKDEKPCQSLDASLSSVNSFHICIQVKKFNKVKHHWKRQATHEHMLRSSTADIPSNASDGQPSSQIEKVNTAATYKKRKSTLVPVLETFKRKRRKKDAAPRES